MSFLHTPTLNIHWESHKESENLYFIYIYIYYMCYLHLGPLILEPKLHL